MEPDMKGAKNIGRSRNDFSALAPAEVETSWEIGAGAETNSFGSATTALSYQISSFILKFFPLFSFANSSFFILNPHMTSSDTPPPSNDADLKKKGTVEI
jgi:hypothetical protein